MVVLLVIAFAAFADLSVAAPQSQFPPSTAFGAPGPFAAPPPPPPPPPFPVRSSFPSVSGPFAQDFAPAAPVAHKIAQPQITIVNKKYLQDDDGQFSLTFSQSDGSNFQETGKLRPTNDRKDNVLVKEGSFRYTSPEGIPVEITYTADEYGFHPHGSVIPGTVRSQPTSFV